TFERIEREVDLLPTRADHRAGCKLLGIGRAADDDLAADRQRLEGEPCTRECRLLRRVLVGPAQPAGAGQRGTLGHARVALAQARRGRVVGHTSTSARTAAASTSSSTAVVALSMSELSITGTRCFSARSTR